MIKNVIKLFIVFVLIVLGYSCSDSNPVSIVDSQFFPLREGNSWNYQSSLGQQWSVRVVGYTKINNVKYSIFETNYGGTKATKYFRADGLGNIYINWEGVEYPYLLFDAKLNDQWDSYYNFFGYVRSRGQSIILPSGEFDNLIEIFFDNNLISDVFSFDFYAPNVGLVRSRGFRTETILVSAFVNGKFYPGE